MDHGPIQNGAHATARGSAGRLVVSQRGGRWSGYLLNARHSLEDLASEVAALPECRSLFSGEPGRRTPIEDLLSDYRAETTFSPRALVKSV
jgi:hypothetical protein